MLRADAPVANSAGTETATIIFGDQEWPCTRRAQKVDNCFFLIATSSSHRTGSVIGENVKIQYDEFIGDWNH